MKKEKDMATKEAFRKVYEFLMTEPTGYFAGTYDALNTNEQFIHGIWSVMDVIAYMAGKSEEFDEIWYENTAKSEEKARKLRYTEVKARKLRDTNENTGK